MTDKNNSVNGKMNPFSFPIIKELSFKLLPIKEYSFYPDTAVYRIETESGKLLKDHFMAFIIHPSPDGILIFFIRDLLSIQNERKP